MTIAYGACLLVSAAIFVYMAQKNYANIDSNYWMIVILAPIVIMGYWLKTQVETPGEAAYLFCFIYFDSTFIMTTALFAMMHALGFQARWWTKALVYIAACVQVAIVCLGVHNGLYYESMTVIPTTLGSATKMTSGPLKLYHYVFLAGTAAWFLGMLLVSVIRRGTYSRRAFVLFGILVGAGMVASIVEGIIDADFTVLPFLYVAGDLAIALCYDYVHTRDIGFVLSSITSSN